MTASKLIYFSEEKVKGRKEKGKRRKEIPMPTGKLFGAPIND